jgi:hypothetical protein
MVNVLAEVHLTSLEKQQLPALRPTEATLTASPTAIPPAHTAVQPEGVLLTEREDRGDAPLQERRELPRSIRSEKLAQSWTAPQAKEEMPKHQVNGSAS